MIRERFALALEEGERGTRFFNREYAHEDHHAVAMSDTLCANYSDQRFGTGLALDKHCGLSRDYFGGTIILLPWCAWFIWWHHDSVIMNATSSSP